MKYRNGLVALALVALASQLTGCGRIGEGNVGVRTNWNKSVETAEIHQGFYWSVFSNVDEFVGKEISVDQNDMKPKAKDNLTLDELDISVFYRANSSMIAEHKIKYHGMSPEVDGVFYPGFTLVDQLSRSVIYDVIGNRFESLTIHNKRNELEEEIRKGLQAELDKQDKGVFTITRVAVRKVNTDRSMEDSIRTAVRVEKQIEAKDKQIQLARKEAERLLVEAQGQANANEVIAASITPNLIKLREIEMQAGFAKQGTHTVLMGGSATPLINVK